MSERLAVVVPVYNEPIIDGTLRSLYHQRHRTGVHHYIVDNGSVDDTRERIEGFAAAHDDFPMSILDEPEKGTGAASDTGFRRAISDGYEIVARTDGDSTPHESWTNRIIGNFAMNRDITLYSGKVTALRDEHYRRGDDLLMSTAVRGARIIMSIAHLNADYLKAATGCNLATLSHAYEEVGGFERSAIDDIDEDIDYSLKIARRYGRDSIRIDPKLEVATSMRRVRSYGVAKTALYHLFPSIRQSGKLDVDVR